MHTIGNWTILDTDSKTSVIAPDPVLKTSYVIVADCHIPAFPIKQQQANARLVSAAPDLLEALTGLLATSPTPKGSIRDNFSYFLYREAARKAIAKAKLL